MTMWLIRPHAYIMPNACHIQLGFLVSFSFPYRCLCFQGDSRAWGVGVVGSWCHWFPAGWERGICAVFGCRLFHVIKESRKKRNKMCQSILKTWKDWRTKFKGLKWRPLVLNQAAAKRVNNLTFNELTKSEWSIGLGSNRDLISLYIFPNENY